VIDIMPGATACGLSILECLHYHGGKHAPESENPPDLGISVSEEMQADEQLS